MKSSVAWILLVFGFFGSLQVGGADLVSYTYTPIDVPGATSNTALGINNAGQIVGVADAHGFLDTNGVFAPINVPGLNVIVTDGINDAGQIVVGGEESFLDSNGVFTPILVPGSMETITFGINNTGQIIGYYRLPNGSGPLGFLDTNGVFTNIDVPGAQFTNPFGINDAGQIVGNFGGNTGGSFLATPIPEPTSLLLFATGLAGIIIAIVRRRMTPTFNH